MFDTRINIVSETLSTILVVDDTPANLGILFEVLDHAGFEVLVSQNGHSAIQRAKTTQPDLILLDVMMPQVDGWEILQGNSQASGVREN